MPARGKIIIGQRVEQSTLTPLELVKTVRKKIGKAVRTVNYYRLICHECDEKCVMSDTAIRGSRGIRRCQKCSARHKKEATRMFNLPINEKGWKNSFL